MSDSTFSPVIRDASAGRPCRRSSSSIDASRSKPKGKSSTRPSLSPVCRAHWLIPSAALLGRRTRQSGEPGRPGRDHPGMERLAQRLGLVAAERLCRPALSWMRCLSRSLPAHPTGSACQPRSDRPSALRRRLQSARATHLSGAGNEAGRLLGFRGALGRATFQTRSIEVGWELLDRVDGCEPPPSLEQPAGRARVDGRSSQGRPLAQ